METTVETRFACDAMLGGLARWLRAAGYDACWTEHIADRQLINRAWCEGRVLLTSDSGILKYKVVRDAKLASLFVPRGLSIHEQLALVLKELNLPTRTPRCMACNGVLIEVSKDSVADRAPPRTFAWLQRFWECAMCKRLFWQGTHWQRIAEKLKHVGTT